MFDKYYEILGLKKGASKDDIKNAYRLLAKKYHPDVSKESDSHERFITIAEAYEILVNRKVIEDLNATTTDRAERQNTYEYFTQQARENAKKASRMRYENLKREHEAFQKSGIYDIMLLLEFAFNYFMVLMAVFMMAFPVYLAIDVGFFGIFFLWIPGIFLILYIKDKGRSFFVPGQFFYNFNELKQVIKNDSGSGTVPCQYSRNRVADAYPYKVSLLKVHNIQLQFGGVLQHRAAYQRSYQKLEIPRCRKAYHMHILASVIKILGILSALFFLPFDSAVWRLMTGMIAAGILSGICYRIAGIRSKVSYLLNTNLLIKIISWIVMIILFTDFSDFPNLRTGDYIMVGILLLLLLQDMVTDPFVQIIARKGRQLLPLLPQPELLRDWYKKGYQPYLEIPVWSTIFPLLKWLF